MDSICSLVEETNICCPYENYETLINNKNKTEYILSCDMLNLETFKFAEELKEIFIYYNKHITTFKEEHQQIKIDIERVTTYNNKELNIQNLKNFLIFTLDCMDRIIQSLTI